MVLAYFIYVLSMLLMLAASFSYRRYVDCLAIGRRDVRLLLFPFISVAIVSILMAIRYEVGTDWESYKYIFESYSAIYNTTLKGTLTNERIEPLYSLLNFVIAKSGGSYQLLLFIVMVIHLSLLMSMCKAFPSYSPLIVVFYFAVLFLSTLNIHRQTMAICIFLVALKYLKNNEVGKYYVWSIVACLFHYSSVIILLVPLLKLKLFRFLDNRYISLGLYVAGFFLGHFLTDIIVTYLPMLTDNAKYNSTIGNLEHVHEYSSGLGLLFYKVLDVLLILNFSKFTKRGLGVYSRTFLVGSVVANAFANSMFLARVALPLTSVKIFLLAIMISDSLQGSKMAIRKLVAIGIIIFTFLGFYMNIANHNSGCSPFQFI